jgi:hypothetical protein
MAELPGRLREGITSRSTLVNDGAGDGEEANAVHQAKEDGGQF